MRVQYVLSTTKQPPELTQTNEILINMFMSDLNTNVRTVVQRSICGVSDLLF